MVKNPLASAGHTRDMGSIPGLERSPGGGCDNPLQYSCLENLMDKGAWRATVHGITESQTEQLTLNTYLFIWLSQVLAAAFRIFSLHRGMLGS